MSPLQSISTYETETHLADLLRQVRAGQGFTITQRGKPVADLLPTGMGARRSGTSAAAKMRQFTQRQPIHTELEIHALINVGRD